MQTQITNQTVKEAFNYLTSIQTILVLSVINNSVESDTLEQFESNAKWIKQCYNRPSDFALRMNALNELIGGYGVETIKNEDIWVNHHWSNIIALYINMGDIYNTTIIYDTQNDCFSITTYADFMEATENIDNNNT